MGLELPPLSSCHTHYRQLLELTPPVAASCHTFVLRGQEPERMDLGAALPSPQGLQRDPCTGRAGICCGQTEATRDRVGRGTAVAPARAEVPS